MHVEGNKSCEGLEIYGILPNDEDGFFWMEWRRPSSPVHLEVFWIRGGPRNGNIEELIANYQGHDSLWRINAGDSLRRMSSFRVGDPFANKNLEFLSEYTRTAAKDGRWVVWDVPDEKVQASRDRSPVQMRWYDLPAPWRYAFLEAINGTGREVRRYFTRVLPKLEEISPMVKTGGWVFSKACLELRTGDQAGGLAAQGSRRQNAL